MAGGKVRHWKHGWIPLTAWAKAQVEGRKGPAKDSPAGKAPNLTADDARRIRYINHENKVAAKDAARRQRFNAAEARKAPQRAAMEARYRAAQARKQPSLMLQAPVSQRRPAVPGGELLDSLKNDGGFTYDPKKGTVVKVGTVDGVAVARPGTEQAVGRGDIGREDFAKAVADVIEAHGDDFSSGAMLGGWYSEDRDVYMVEVTDVFPDRASAIQAGKDRNQEGVFDLKTGDYIDTGGTGDGQHQLALTDNAILNQPFQDQVPSPTSSFSSAADTTVQLVAPSTGPGQQFWPDGVPAISKVGVFNQADGERLADAWAVSGPLLEKYAALEPDVTPGLVSAAAANGGYMLGLQNRLKERDSLTRKLYDKAPKKGLTPAQYGEKLGDTLRYTMVTPPDSLAEATQKVIDGYRKRGYKVEVENTWPDPNATYRGINTNFIAPDGRIFEVQFHTQQSFDVKTEQHPLYDIARSNTSTPEARAAANAAMEKNMATMVRPPGVNNVK